MRILIVRIGRAGDIIMTTPAISAIIDCYPDAKITLLTSNDGRRLLKDYHPNIDDLWIWNRSGALAHFSKLKIIKKLQEIRFDKIFCFETNRRIAGLFSSYGPKLHWSDTLDKNRHCSANYLDMVKQTCPSLSGDYYAHLPVSEDAIKRVNDELSSMGISHTDTVVMLHPTYSGYNSNKFFSLFSKKHHLQSKHRLWPAKDFSKLGSLLSELQLPNNTRPKIIMDLMPDEAQLGNEIVEHTHGSVALLLVPPNFERYKALIRRANLLVTANTGPLHVAAAVDTEIVALFSRWNPVDCGPFMRPDRYTTLRAEDTQDPEQGLSSISVDSVFQACKQHLLPGG